ncbi:MAG: YigZ family protein [Bacteroidales bacterium]|nr:YigZ family protein [Bacteroidales bacterium]
MERYTFKILKAEAEGIFKDRGSKFIAYAYPVESEESVKEIIGKLRKEHHSARHHCYAYRIGFADAKYRMNDDGEPSGTAGKPIYGQLLSFDVTNTLIVVVRYFGGTLLGTPGLINAYRSAAEDCLRQAVITEYILTKGVRIGFDYSQLNLVMRVLSEEGVGDGEKTFMERCTMMLDIPLPLYEKVMGRLGKIPEIQIDDQVLK